MYALIYLFNPHFITGGSRRKKGQSIRRSHDATDATLSSSTRKKNGRNGHAEAEERIDRIQQYFERSS